MSIKNLKVHCVKFGSTYVVVESGNTFVKAVFSVEYNSLEMTLSFKAEVEPFETS